MDISSSSSAGIFNWSVDGTDILAQSWFWYRVGGVGGEAPVNSIGGPTLNQYLNNSMFRLLDLTYANASYSVRTVFSMTGGDAGTGNANLSETLTVVNLTAGSLDFHFFQYSDFDLGGADSVVFSQNTVNGQYYKATQTSISRILTETITSAAPPIGHFEAGIFPATLNSLNDGLPTTLTDTISAGPGDTTFAYQWDVTLDPGASFQISKLVSVVPEPSASVLVLAGIAVLGWLQRRQRAG